MEVNGIKVSGIKTNKKEPVKNTEQNNGFATNPQRTPSFDGQYTPQMFGVLPNFKLAKTIGTTPVSFKGIVLKKSDFKGTDLAVIERYKPNIQQFKSKDDLQKFAEGKINELKEKDFGGRQEETRIQRKAMLKEWFDYVIKENDAYSNTQRLIILSAVTKDLKANNDTIPPVLNKGVLAQTVTELEEKLKANPKENFDFNKMYQNNLKTDILDDNDTGETMTGWIVIPSKINDPENFAKNVDKLKVLSHKNWCTKSFNAEPYLSQGDFHVYLENGQPKLGVRFVGDKVEEIQGEKNNGKIPQKYFETFKEHQQECDMKLSYQAQSEVKNAEAVKVELQKVKQELGSAVELNTIDEAVKIFDYVGIKAEKKDDMLVISEYRQPDKKLEYDFEDLGIDEIKLFENVVEISGNADFTRSGITDLGQLQSIGGNADFRDSKITDLGQLQSIGGNASFYSSEITDLGQLQSIGGNADFTRSGITDLGQLQSIGGDADFRDSKITDLGQLQHIGKNAIFYKSKITDLGQLQSIGGNAKFKDSKITNLGQLDTIGGLVYADSTLKTKLLENLTSINNVNLKELNKAISEENIEKIFNALRIEVKKDENGKLIISKYKQPNLGLDLTFADLGIDEIKLFENVVEISGNADFTRSGITDLGQLKSIGGNADFSSSKNIDLGQLQSIGGNADFRDSKITNLGQLQSIGGNANFIWSKITNLGQLQNIGGNADFSNSKNIDLGQLQSIGGNADFYSSEITDLGQLQSIGGNASFYSSEITDLGQLKSIGGNADFYSSEITDLGQLQSIGGNADFTGSGITDLGQLQSIGGNANFTWSKITNLGQLQSIAGDALLQQSEITELGQLQYVGGHISLITSKLTDKDFENVKRNQNSTNNIETENNIEKVQSKDTEPKQEQPQQKQSLWSIVKNVFKQIIK